MSCALVLTCTPVSAFAESLQTLDASVSIDATNFPDAAFRAYVLENCDADGDQVLSTEEIEAVEEIDVSGSSTDELGGVSSLEGIEYFSALKTLRCNYNSLVSLDISQNTELEMLLCTNNKLTAIDLSNNLDLDYVALTSNSISSIDLSNNLKLSTFVINSNQLTALDVTANTELTALQFNNNKVTSIDVSHNTKLTTLYCSGNLLTEIDLSHNPNIVRFDISDNQLTSLDILNGGNTADGALTMIIRSCGGNAYTITLDADYSFDLSTLPGSFDVSRARNWSAGTLDGTVITLKKGVTKLTYDYVIGYYMGDYGPEPLLVEFTLNIPDNIDQDAIDREKRRLAAIDHRSFQTIIVNKVHRTVKAKRLQKKPKKLTFKVVGAKTKLCKGSLTKKTKKALKVKCKGKKKIVVKVRKKAKKGTYKFKVWAKSTKKYKPSGKRTITIKVK